MKKSNSTLRYARYRASGWIFNSSNVVYLSLILGIMMLVFVAQKIDSQQYPIRLFSSGIFPEENKRREIIVTTVRVSDLKIARTTKCNNESTKLIKLDYTSFKLFNSTLKQKKKSETFLHTTMSTMTYRDKIEMLKRKLEAKKSLDKTKKLTSDLVPDIYRIGHQFDVPQEGNSKQIYQDRWLSIHTGSDKVLAYSAYWDERFAIPTVRIIAILKTKLPTKVYCKFKAADGRYYNTTAKTKIMNEHWRLKYSSYFIGCEYIKAVALPTKISLSTDVTFAHETILPIHRNKNDSTSPRGNMAVCVKPLHYNYDRATWLIEFIELHRLLGVEHFYFYNHTTGPNVELALTNYINLGVVTTLPWEIGIKSQTDIRTEGIFSSLNDCLFRTMYLFKYVIMLDFDEYIIPRDHDTYQDMIFQIEDEHKHLRGKPGSFVFRNVFFYLYWENDTTAFGVEPEKPPDYLPYLLTQYKTRRLLHSMKPGSRSKYIVIPERAIEVGNHVVWRHASGSVAINVPDTMATLHHYRICEFGGFSCLKKKSAVDQVATRFGPELLDRVRNQCKKTFRPDGQCPLSPPLGSPW